MKRKGVTSTNIILTDTDMIYLISTVPNMKSRDLLIILKKKQVLEEGCEDTTSMAKRIAERTQK